MLFPGHAKSLRIHDAPASESPSRPPVERAYSGSGEHEERRKSETARQRHMIDEAVNGEVVDDKGTPASKTLWLHFGDTPIPITGTMLKKAFGIYGAIESTNPAGDNLSKYGFAYVNYANIDNAIQARSHLNGKKIFEDYGAPVLIRFNRKTQEMSEPKRSSLGHRDPPLPPSPKERLSEWFRSRTSSKTDGEIRRQISSERLNDLLPKRKSITDHADWPNGPPPTGPRSRPRDISPPPIWRGDSYRIERMEFRGDCYRPGLEQSGRARTSPDNRHFQHSTGVDQALSYEKEDDPGASSNRKYSSNNDHHWDRAGNEARHYSRSLTWISDKRRKDQSEAVPLGTALRPSDSVERHLRNPRTDRKRSSADDTKHWLVSRDDMMSYEKNAAPADILSVEHGVEQFEEGQSIPLPQLGPDSDPKEQGYERARKAITQPKQMNEERPFEVKELPVMPLFTSIEKGALGPTTESLVELSATEEHSDQAPYSPKLSLFSPEGLVQEYPFTYINGAVASNLNIQTDGTIEAFGALDVHTEVPTTFTTIGRNSSSRILHARRHLGVNDETCSVASDRTGSERSHRTGISTTSSSFQKTTCYVCLRIAKSGKPLLNCAGPGCKKRYHWHCSGSAEGAFKCSKCGSTRLDTEITSKNVRIQQEVVNAPTAALFQTAHENSVNNRLNSASVFSAGLESSPNVAAESFAEFEKIPTEPLETVITEHPLDQSVDDLLFTTHTDESMAAEPSTSVNYNNTSLSDQAHQNLLVPAKRHPGKDYTCWWWKNRGACRFSAETCYYSHDDTGLLSPAPGKAAGKLLTCHFWLRGGCQKTADECSFAHYDTGTHAHDPALLRKQSTEISPGESSDRPRHSYFADHWLPNQPGSPVSARPTMASDTDLKPLPGSSSTSTLNGWLAGTTRENMKHLDEALISQSPAANTSHLHTLIGLPPSQEFTRTATQYITRQPLLNGNRSPRDCRLENPLEEDSHTLAKDPSDPMDPSERVSASWTSGRSNSPIQSKISLEHRLNSSERPFESPYTTTLTASRPILGEPVRDQDPNSESTYNPLKMVETILVTPTTDLQPPGDKVSINRCQACSKAIFGSLALCKACEMKSKDSVGSSAKSPPGSSGSDATRTKDDDDIVRSPALAREPNEISRLVPKRTSSKPLDPPRSLKRASTDNLMFIPNKKTRRYSAIPIGIRLPPIDLPVSPVDQIAYSGSALVKSPVKSPIVDMSLEELTELERSRRRISMSDEAPPEFQATSDETHPQNMEVKSSSEQEQSKSPATSLAPVNSESLQEAMLVQVREASKSVEARLHDLVSTATEALQSVPEPGSINTPSKQQRLQEQTPLFRKQPSISEESRSSPKGACPSCRYRRMRCLHDISGRLDPEKCRIFKNDHKDDKDGSDGKRTREELEEIKAAASRSKAYPYSPDETEETDGSEEEELPESYQETSEEELNCNFGPSMNSSGKIGTRSPSKKAPAFANRVAAEKAPKATVVPKSSQNSTWTKEDEQNAISKLKARGVVFESDSDSESDHDEEEENWQPPAPMPRPRDPLWQGPKRSRNLFDVAPEYLENKDEDGEAAWNLVSPKRLTRKQQKRDFLAWQCAERKAKYGNPHWEVERLPVTADGEPFPRLVRTVEERKVVPFNAAAAGKSRSGNVFDVQISDKKMVEMPFDKFLGMPERPVACLIGQGQSTWGRQLGSRALGAQLGFRDGGKEREGSSLGLGWRRGSGRVRVPDEEKWPVGAKA